MTKNKKLVLVLSLMFIMAFALTGCGTAPASSDNNNDASAKSPVRIVYVEWSCATATSHVVADILEHKMGYEVELIPISAAVMFEGLGNGDADASFCVWLPTTHEAYMSKQEGKVVNIGTNMEGAKIGLVVPQYVSIASIDQLEEHKDQFNQEIIGIDPGAGMMKNTEQLIEDYNLDFTLVEGSGATMTAALKNAISKNEWIVVTGWTPHWKWAKWDLKYLEDPKGIFGTDQRIDTVVRKGFKEEMPEVYAFFENFHWTSEDLGSAMMLGREENATSVSAARKWVEQNEELVNSWLPASPTPYSPEDAITRP